MSLISVDMHADPSIAIVKLERDQSLNALSSALLDELDRELEKAESDKAIKVVILAGGERAFAAGADIAEMFETDPEEAIASDYVGSSAFLKKVSKPVVAAVEGLALGGGCELVEMCDIVIGSETARFGHPEVKLALMPGAGGSQRLTRLVGKHRAMDLLLTGRLISAQEAYEMGLVSRLSRPGEALADAITLAKELTGFSATALSAIKRSTNLAFQEPLDGGLHHEKELFHTLLKSPEARAALKAFLDGQKR